MKIPPLRRWHALLVTLLAAVALAHAAPPDRGSIVELGALGSRGSIALALNNRGDVGGYSAWTAPGGDAYFHAFVWRNGTMTDLGAELGSPPGHGHSQVSAINDAGVAAVRGPDGLRLWQDGAWTPLGFGAAVNDIDKFGRLVGSYGDGSSGTRAYLWREGTIVTIPTLGGRIAEASALNDRGTIVGSSLLADETTFRGFVWKDGVTTPLGTLGGASSHAVDINNRGTVVGYSQDASGTWKAFIHDGAGMRALAGLPAGNSNAVAIDDRGVVLVESDAGAFLWDEGAITWLADLPAVKAAGWSRLFPIDMNDRGAIVGWGWKPGGPVEGLGFLLELR